MSLETIRVGMKRSLTRVVASTDVQAFGSLTEDDNPIHYDDAAAREKGFESSIAHGMLVGSFFSTLIGRDLPGKGSVYLGQSLKFVRPVYVGEVVTAEAEVIAVREDKPIVTLRTTCRNSKGEIVIEGEAVVKVGNA